MTQGALAMETPTTTVPRKYQGFFVSRACAFLLIVVALASLVVTAVLFHHLAATSYCPDSTNADDHARPASVPAFAAKTDVRLPTNVLPHRYTLKLIPHLWDSAVGNFTFSGSVTVLVNVTAETKNITLHAHDLNIRSELTRLHASDGSSSETLGARIMLAHQETDEFRQFHIIHTAAPLSPGQYDLQLTFTGNLNDLLQGFYRSSYTQDGNTKWIATTQFQPTDARRAFPCFDEPAMKAKFKISIARPRELTSVSNMPRIAGKSESLEGLSSTYVWDHFEESVPMSTYLVSFVVSELSYKRNGTFSVWARRDALGQAEYALKVGPPILRYFETFFDIPFPLPKIDMVALPDFAAGAMENWGLITFRETAMLFEEGVSTSSNKQRVATVVSHELAHQWFGNLVTPSWWSDLWLNEGFASYVEYLGVDAVEPTWRVMEQFVIDEVQNVFSLDALETSHPISVVVGHPDEINEIFDRISYGKGASIIRMMDHFLGSAVFTKGLHNYLKSKQFSSATQNDLWDALTDQAHKDGALEKGVSVNTIMDTWTLQTGFPVLNVTRDYEKGFADVVQERFLLNPRSGKGGGDVAPLWWVPITYTTSREKNFNSTKTAFWLRAQPSGQITNLPMDKVSWMVVNIQQTGFYRVNYDTRNWGLLTEALKSPDFGGLPVVTRSQLLDDALNLARSGRLDYGTAMNVTRYLQAELEYLPWKSALTALGYLDSMLIRTASYAHFKAYIMQLISKLYEETGFFEKPGEPQLTSYKRINMLSWACSLGHVSCVNNSVAIFKKWLAVEEPDKQNPIPANLKNVIYCTAIKHGGQEEWDFAWARYKNTNVGSEKDLLLSSLGCTRETWILSRYLLWAVTEDSGIRKQDSARVFASVSSNVIGQPLAFSFLRDEWSRIKDYLGTSLFSVSSMVRSATRRLQTTRELSDLRQFATLHQSELGTAKRAVDQALERAEANVRWMKYNSATIEDWLSRAVVKDLAAR